VNPYKELHDNAVTMKIIIITVTQHSTINIQLHHHKPENKPQVQIGITAQKQNPP
jgi:hypothetical protein